MTPILDSAALLPKLRELHAQLRDGVFAAVQAAVQNASLETLSRETLSQATVVRGGDTIFALDLHADEVLLPFCAAWGQETPFLLVAEGLENGRQLFGCDDVSGAQFQLICDPVDGTRPLMYDKRSAWLLTGVAPNFGDETNLSHLQVAMMTELPTSKARYSDSLCAVAGLGARGVRHDLTSGHGEDFAPQPSRANTIEGGFASLTKFFPGSKEWLARLEETLLLEILGPPSDAQPQTFDDQYISTGGQMFELMTGRDRFNADLRPFAHAKLHGGASARMCCHPYDACCELIARELGCIITDENGGALNAPLDVDSPVSWIGYANAELRAQVEPVLLRLLRECS